MPKQKNGKKEPSNDNPQSPSRRNLLVGSGALVTGGIAGHVTGASSASAQDPSASAPDLPWPWKTIDPMEAGTRTYKAYLTQGG